MQLNKEEKRILKMFVTILVISLIIFAVITWCTALFYINQYIGIFLIIYSILFIFTILYFIYKFLV